MNPQFKIHGQERKALKKQVGLLRRSISNFWHHWQTNDDMYNIFGHENPWPKEEAEKHHAIIVAEIEEKEKLLAVAYENFDMQI